MLLANKHFTPIIGIDIHIIVIPPGIPTPIPHPFIGMIMDPTDYIPFIGASVFINKVPRGNSESAGIIGTMAHIPMGGPFLLAPMIGHDAVNFFGSIRVKAEGSFLSPAGYMLMTCSDVGVPLSLTPGKKMKPIPSLYLPTSNTISIPGGQPVIVGGPYAPDLMAMFMGLVMSYGMGALKKGASKVTDKALKALNHKVLKKFECTQGLSNKLCKMGFEPVDLITGRMIYEGEDFTLPGLIPITWKRSWYSDSAYEGLLGYGVHNNYDLSIHVETQDDVVVMILPDGRATLFPWLVNEGEQFYNRQEKLTLSFVDKNTYTVLDHSSELTYTFKKVSDNLYKPFNLGNKHAAISFNYDPSNRLNQIIDSVGRVIDLDLDNSGRVIKISAKHREQQRTLATYQYNKQGDLMAITDALGQSTQMIYENHLMVKKTDRNGQSFYWEYDDKQTGAKCIKTWGDGDILSGHIQFGDNHNIVTNSLGEETIYYFNSDNLCTQVKNPLGDSIFHEYTEFMEPYRDIDEEGNIVGYSYDQRGNLTKIHNKDGSVITKVYDEQDRLILSKNPEGDAVTRVYKNDQLDAVIDAGGAVTSFTYNSFGLIASIANDLGHDTAIVYDEDHNLHKMTSSDNSETIWDYDEWGRCIRTTNSEQQRQHYFYDALDRVEKVQLADKNTIKLRYNAYDEVIESLDAQNRKINFDYTPLGNLKMREENGRKVHFRYNTEEQLLAITNEHNEFYRFGRNANGDIINETGFDGLRKDYKRDRVGKIIKTTRPDDRFTEYEYDVNGNLTRSEYHDGSWETYNYDRNGNLVECANQQTHVKLIRDAAGRVIKEIQDGHEVASVYNNSSLRAKLSSSLGADIELSYNSLGQLNHVKAAVDHGQQTLTNWEAKLGYNSLGQEIERILPGGVTNTMEYDFAGRPVSHKVLQANKEIRHRSYTWDANDQLQKMVNLLTSGVVNYRFDDFGSLASAQYEDKQFDYKLPDEVGNLYKTKEKNDRQYGSGGQLLKSGKDTYKYDGEGNLILKTTPKGNWEYAWFGNGMLKSVKKPNNKKIEFQYDALGRRTAKINEADDIIQRYIYDGNVLLHEFSYPLSERPKWVVDDSGVLAPEKPENTENLITWVFDEGTFIPSAKITKDGTYSIITDYLGTPVEAYNSDGEKVWERELDIYGKARKGDSGFIPFLYQGQYYDHETELAYNRFRYYSPDTGAYISQDPIGIAGNNPNLYAYVGDLNSWIDVFGLSGTSTPQWVSDIYFNNDVDSQNLKSKLSALENASNNAANTQTLPDGRKRYYGAEKSSRTSGPTRGASYVTEYDPKTGNVRSWMESYDHSGKVNRVHPKMKNGVQINLPHYPPTKADIDSGIATPSGKAIKGCR